MPSSQISSPAEHLRLLLTTSRAYFGLPPEGAASPQPTIVSIVASKLQRNPMSTYRKGIQSFLLAAGIGAFVAAPAMADPGCGHMGGNTEQRAKMMEQHHNRLHEALKLSAEQEPAWQKLMDAEQIKPALSGGKPEDWAKLNTPARAEKMLELTKARQEHMAEHVAALKTFYAVLTPEQQKAFDDFHTASRGRMDGGKGRPPAGMTDKAAGKS